MTGYWDIVVVLCIAALMLLILDWRIGRAFKGHERREQEMYASIALTADGAAGRAIEMVRHVESMRAETVLLRVDVANIGEQVKMHDRRLGAVEERIMRTALTVPHSHRREDDP
jgi:hypothetical protein